jgi:hypothetical protein
MAAAPRWCHFVEFDKYWQYFLLAINMPMRENNVAAIMNYQRAMMNRIGTGNPGDRRRDYIIGANLDAPKNPATDKFRSMNLNTHLGRDDGEYMYPLALDGTHAPEMQVGRTPPRDFSEIDLYSYMYRPETHPWFFVDLTNVKWKPGTQTLDYGPWDHGVLRPWTHDETPHTYFPFVTTYKDVKTPLSWWRKLMPGERIPSAFRNG